MENFKDPKLIIDKIDTLKKDINKANFKYYVLESSDISDSQYDSMLKELINIEKENPNLITSDSPTQRVGAPPSKSFEEVIHNNQMLSLSNVFNEKTGNGLKMGFLVAVCTKKPHRPKPIRCEDWSCLHVLPSAVLCRIEHCVADLGGLKGIAEGWVARRAFVEALQEVGHLVHKGVLVTDAEARYPPFVHVRHIVVGDVNASPTARY